MANLLLLLQQFADAKTVNAFTQANAKGTIRYAGLKATLADAVAAHLAPIQAAKAKLLAKPARLEAILASGAKRAANVATATLAAVQNAAGLRRY